MRINKMLPIRCILYAELLLVAMMPVYAAPQVRPVNQDVAEPEEYVDSGPGGRKGDEWWRNYEAVEDHVKDFDDHLEMFYMYSVNPLELTTVRSISRGTPPPYHSSPSSAATPITSRRSSTTTTEIPFVPAVSRTPVLRRSTTIRSPQPQPPTELSPVRPGSRPFISRRPSTQHSQQPTEPPFVHPGFEPAVANHPNTFQSQQPIEPPVAQSFAPRRTSAAFPTTEAPAPTFPAHPGFPLPQGPEQDHALGGPEEFPAQRGRTRVRVRRPSAVKPDPQSQDTEPGIFLNAPHDVFLPESTTSTVHPQFLPVSLNNDITAFSPNRQSQNPPEAHGQFGGSPALQNPMPIPTSNVAVNPFLATHPPLPRYSPLLNRYSILDEINRQPDLTEAGRSVRQPAPVVDGAFPPSARNFEAHTTNDATAATSRRPRRRRLRTTTVPPTSVFTTSATVQQTVFDSELSDSEEVLVSQQPGPQVRSTRSRIATSFATTTPSALESPELLPLPQTQFLPPQTPTARPLFSGKRRRTTAQPLATEPEAQGTADSTPDRLTDQPVKPFVDVRTTLLPRPTFARPDRPTKSRPLFVESSTAPAIPEELATVSSTDSLKSDETDPEVNTESFRIQTRRFQASRRGTTTTATTTTPVPTTEIPLATSLLPEVQPPQQPSNRFGKFRQQKPANLRLFGSGAAEKFPSASVSSTAIPSPATPVSDAIAIQTTVAAASPLDAPPASTLPPQTTGSTKFKPRNTFRRTTTTTTTAATTDAISITSDLSTTPPPPPPEPVDSRFKPKGSKFRGFTPATTSSSTEIPPDVSSPESLDVTTVTITESRKFKPRSGFPRFQDSIKRTTTTTTPEPSTTTTVKPSRFKPKTTVSRFQPQATKNVPTATTEVEELVSPTTPQPGLSPEPSTRPLFNKARTTRIFPSKSPFSSSLPSSTLSVASTASPSVQPIASTLLPVDDATASPIATDGRSSGKSRRRPVTKKSPLQSASRDASDTLPSSATSSHDDFSAVVQPKERSRSFATVDIPAITPSFQQTELHAPEPADGGAEPKRRKLRRRKLTQRSTQPFRGDVFNAVQNLNATVVAGDRVSSPVAATTTVATVIPKNLTHGDASKSFSVAGSLANNAEQQLSLQSFDLDDPLQMEADETGDDSGIWFSDSASIRNEGIETFARSGGGGGGGGNPDKWFQIEPENSSIKNPSSSQLRRLGDTDSKSWFGLADESVPKAAESSPERTTIIQNVTESHSTLISRADVADEVEQEGSTTTTNQESKAEEAPKMVEQSKAATFSVSSSTSIQSETSKTRTSQSSSQPKQEDSFKIEEGSPKIIIIDRVTLDDSDRDQNGERSKEKPTEKALESDERRVSGAEGSEKGDKPARTGDSAIVKASSDSKSSKEQPQEEKSGGAERSGRERTASKSSRDRDSRTDKSDSRSSGRTRGNSTRNAPSRATSSRSSGRDRSSSSRRDRSSTTTTTTTTESPATETTENVDINETTKKKSPSDEVGYFGEDEVAPVAHGALDGPVDEGAESGVFDSLGSDFQSEGGDKSSDGGEVASVDVSEHNDPNDKGHNSESAIGDESSLWGLSPLSEFSGPIRESSSFKVEVRSRAPKLIQLAARREAKSSRSDLSDDFSTKSGSPNKVRNFLKMIGVNGAVAEAEEVGTSSVNATELPPVDDVETTAADKRGIPLKGFAYPVPPLKTAEDIAELFDIITSAPADVPKLFRPPSKATILKLNSSSAENATARLENVSAEGLQGKVQVLNGPANCSRSDRNICPTSETYPRQLVELIVKQHEGKMKRLWQELQAYRTPSQLYPDDVKRQKDDLSVCDSSIEALHPGWARDAISGKWMLIVNTPQYSQVLRVESCLRLKKECLFISPYYKSSCVEHYSAHRMVAIRPDDPASGPVVGIFKFPCGCSCRVGMINGGN